MIDRKMAMMGLSPEKSRIMRHTQKVLHLGHWEILRAILDIASNNPRCCPRIAPIIAIKAVQTMLCYNKVDRSLTHESSAASLTRLSRHRIDRCTLGDRYRCRCSCGTEWNCEVLIHKLCLGAAAVIFIARSVRNDTLDIDDCHICICSHIWKTDKGKDRCEHRILPHTCCLT